MENYTSEEIYRNYSLLICDDGRLRRVIADVLSKVSRRVVDEICEKCLILVTHQGDDISVIPSIVKEGREIIVLPETLFDESQEVIERKIYDFFVIYCT